MSAKTSLAVLETARRHAKNEAQERGQWKCSALNDSIKKIDETGSTGRKQPGSG